MSESNLPSTWNCLTIRRDEYEKKFLLFIFLENLRIIRIFLIQPSSLCIHEDLMHTDNCRSMNLQTSALIFRAHCQWLLGYLKKKLITSSTFEKHKKNTFSDKTQSQLSVCDMFFMLTFYRTQIVVWYSCVFFVLFDLFVWFLECSIPIVYYFLAFFLFSLSLAIFAILFYVLDSLKKKSYNFQSLVGWRCLPFTNYYSTLPLTIEHHIKKWCLRLYAFF